MQEKDLMPFNKYGANAFIYWNYMHPKKLIQFYFYLTNFQGLRYDALLERGQERYDALDKGKA